MLKSVGPDEALALVLEHTQELPARELPLEESVGLVLAAAVHADLDYPPFDRAAMDGYAVRATDAGGVVRVAGEAAAGTVYQGSVDPGTAVEIMTGAPCPPGTEAVVPWEDVARAGDEVTLPPAVERGQHIAAVGSECRRGAAVITPGMPVSPLAVAVLATFGARRVRVLPPPRVSVIVTGDEIAPPGREPGPAQIRDSNGAMLAALAREARAAVDTVHFAGDSAEALRAALAGTRGADVVVLTGGVSAGKYDLVPALLAELGAEVVFHKVTQKPGKPLLFARSERRLVFGLPGNPLSAHLGFSRYVAAAITKMSGRPSPPPEQGVLAAAVRVRSERTSFVLARARRGGSGFTVEARIGRGSADIFAAAPANAYLRFEPGSHDVAAGSPVTFVWAGAPG